MMLQNFMIPDQLISWGFDPTYFVQSCLSQASSQPCGVKGGFTSPQRGQSHRILGRHGGFLKLWVSPTTRVFLQKK